MNDKIMIVDDEEHIRMLYAEELEDEGYIVVTVSTGFNIVKKIEIEYPDIVVIDIQLRDYNGLDLLQAIKNRFEDIPVGICSAYDTFREDMKSTAADFYVLKSHDLEELKNNIASSLDHYRQKRKLKAHFNMSANII
ncbi:MAG: response regulator [Desulfatiglans sp.]|nr:response regulator [Desulfatiglans sp.]